MKKISTKLLVSLALLGSSSIFTFANPLSSIASSSFQISIGAPIGYNYDRYHEMPVYFLNGNHYYGGQYRNDKYYVNNQVLRGGQYYQDARRYENGYRRYSVLERIIMPLLVGYQYDRYTNSPTYFYNGNHYYSGVYRNGSYYINNQRLHGGRYYTDSRIYQKHHHRNSVSMLDNNSNYRTHSGYRNYREDENHARLNDTHQNNRYNDQRDDEYRDYENRNYHHHEARR